MVLLRHELPEGSWHFDWMLERPGSGASALRTFRVLVRPDHAPEFPAESLPDHRRIYLHYEGPVSNNRGHVTRVAAGEVELLDERPDRIEIVGELAGRRARWQGRATPDGRWLFTSSAL
ncbi:MAG: hypothetical protein SFY95_01885 [Planctomycetota bacterium]|nr:hypothetical protein [Planctomycetota bacterium]